jgi:hypothetical protein
VKESEIVSVNGLVIGKVNAQHSSEIGPEVIGHPYDPYYESVDDLHHNPVQSESRSQNHVNQNQNDDEKMSRKTLNFQSGPETSSQ